MNAKPIRATLPGMFALVMAYFEMSPDILRGPERSSLVANARGWVAFLGRYATASSWQAIGDLINRDHTTASHGAKRIANLLDSGDVATWSQFDGLCALASTHGLALADLVGGGLRADRPDILQADQARATLKRRYQMMLGREHPRLPH